MFARYIVALSMVLATAASAHTGHGSTDGFFAGLAHPFTGWDHWVAMLAVGLWAAQSALASANKRLLWEYPAAFMGMMTLGAFAAVQGLLLPLVENGILLSLIVFGVLLATAARLPTGLALGLVGVLAVFHGQAHGAEIPSGVSAWGYGAGFLLATAFFHAVGVAVGYWGGRMEQTAWPHTATRYMLRLSGVCVAALGLALSVV